jgi:hypothetical protein
LNKVNILKIKRILKNGLYIDFFFKNFIYVINIKITNSIFFNLIDKYFSNIVFNSFKNVSQYVKFILNILNKQNLKNLLVLILLLIIQVSIIIIL